MASINQRINSLENKPKWSIYNGGTGIVNVAQNSVLSFNTTEFAYKVDVNLGSDRVIIQESGYYCVGYQLQITGIPPNIGGILLTCNGIFYMVSGDSGVSAENSTIIKYFNSGDYLQLFCFRGPISVVQGIGRFNFWGFKIE